MLEIKTVKKGAELISAKFDGKEMMHDGVEFWNRHSPILFPIVGQIKDGKSIINGIECYMGQHGFARDMEFEEIGENSYVLKYSEETMKKFPYKFELYVSYEVVENSIKVNWKVVNCDDKNICFGIGAHPAFKCEYSKEDVYLELEKEENDSQILRLENGLINTNLKHENKIIVGKIIKINSNTFDNDAIIISNINSKSIKLIENGITKLEVDFAGFKYLAIWAKKDANFICIEPWYNTADYVDSDGIYEHKKDIIELGKGEIFETSYIVKF